MIFDVRKPGFPWHLLAGVRLRDAETREEIPMVFYFDTETGRLGRYATDASGWVLVDAAGDGAAEIWETRNARFETPDGRPLDLSAAGQPIAP